MRSLGHLAVLVVALFALGGSASAAQFHSEVETTFLFGEQETEFLLKTEAGNIKCKKNTATQNGVVGTKIEAANFGFAELELTETTGECTAFGQVSTIHWNGCKRKETAASATMGNIKYVCPAGKLIEVTVPSGNCTVTVPAQTPKVSTVDYSLVIKNGKRAIKRTSTVSGLVTVVDGPGSICGKVGESAGSTLEGTIVLAGYTSEAHTTPTGVWVE